MIGTIVCQTNDGPFPMAFKSGYVGVTDVPDKNKSFYFFTPSKDGNENAPLVIWLNGGPGCSSMGGAASENGPFSVDPDTKKAIVREISWNNKADVLYLDQPIGTGFSIAQDEKLAKDGEDIKKYFYQFLTKWLELDDFKKYKKRPLYITGESYAGHYIPQMANYLIRQANPDINLQGIAIGNNVSSRWIQWMKYTDYMRWNKDYTKFDDDLFKKLESRIELFKSLESQNFAKNPLYTQNKLQDFYKIKQEILDNYIKVTGNEFGYNPYDTRKKCLKSGDCNLTHSLLEDFYNTEEVKTALGIPAEKKWIQCSGRVGAPIRKGPDYFAFVGDEFELILNSGLKTLIYNGLDDSVCDFKGVEYLLQNLKWYGNRGWNQLTYKSGLYGDYKEYENLKFIKIKEAGHFVPLDQPQIALDMINEFIGVN